MFKDEQERIKEEKYVQNNIHVCIKRLYCKSILSVEIKPLELYIEPNVYLTTMSKLPNILLLNYCTCCKMKILAFH